MNQKGKKTGKELEQKVSALLEEIFKREPQYRACNFIVRWNHTIIVDDVPYQIDVYVEALTGTDHKSFYIYECKDWNRPVGKDRVDALAKTVEITGATKGFLVAKKFTEHAYSAFAREKRVEPLQYRDEFTNLNIEVTHLIHDPVSRRALLIGYGCDQDFFRTDDVQKELCTFRGQEMPFLKMIDAFMLEAFAEYKDQNLPLYNSSANHYGTHVKMIQFSPGELQVTGKYVQSMNLYLQFFVYFIPMQAISTFELQGRGRTCTFVPVNPQPVESDIRCELLMRAPL